MHLVTNCKYDNITRTWSFLVYDITKTNLLNANQFLDQKNKYKFRVPFFNEQKVQFSLVGDGVLVTEINGLVQEFAYVIVRNVNSDKYYALLSSSFSAEFEQIKGDN